MKSRIVATLFASAVALGCPHAFAGSTINPSIPASNAPLNSAPVRQNFQSAYNDINNILSMYYGPQAPNSPSNLQSWANSSGYPNIVLSYFNAITGHWIEYATINASSDSYAPYFTSGFLATAPLSVTFPSGVPTFALNYDSAFTVSNNKLALAPIASGALLGNSSGSAAEPAAVQTGSGVLAALAINIGSSGSVITNGGALGKPSSGDASNLTGTAAGLTVGNASELLGGTWASPGNIGTGAPARGIFNDITIDTSNIGNVTGWGGHVMWNSAGADETDFINNKATGAGGFNFYNLYDNVSAFGAPLATLDPSGNFYPGTANTGSLGTSANPWLNIYAGTGRFNSWVLAPATGGAYAYLSAPTSSDQASINFQQAGVNEWSFGQQSGATPYFFVYNNALNQDALHIDPVTNSVSFGSTTASTSPTTGAVTVAGGLGVVGDINSGGIVGAPFVQVTGVTGGISFADRQGGSNPSYVLYANGGSAFLYDGTANVVQVNGSSGLWTFPFGLADSTLSTPGIVTNDATGHLGTETGITPTQCPAATSSAIGCAKPDGTTITVSGGVLTAVGAATTSIDAGGATSVTNGTPGGILIDNGGKVGMGVAASSLVQNNVADQTISGGANLTSYNLVTLSGSVTVDCGKNNNQYFTNGGAITLNAPANDGTCYMLDTNGASAGAITFSGFTEGSNTGDPLDTTSGHQFGIMINRTNGVSHYLITAYQ